LLLQVVAVVEQHSQVAVVQVVTDAQSQANLQAVAQALSLHSLLT
jgi:hypothetical protein